MIHLVALAALTASFAAVHSSNSEVSWRDILKRQLPLLGHRNWIVVADSAYPWQTSPGVETIDTGADQVEVVKAALEAFTKVSHVRPEILMDAELPFVAEADAKGVTTYRTQITHALQGHGVKSLPHEQIIHELDEAGKTFHVLLLKTKMTIPYTSVFMRLNCGYWSDEAEARLRQSMKSTGG